MWAMRSTDPKIPPYVDRKATIHDVQGVLQQDRVVSSSGPHGGSPLRRRGGSAGSLFCGFAPDNGGHHLYGRGLQLGHERMGPG